MGFGIRLTKVHQIVSLKQSPWLRAYNDFSTQMKKGAKDEFVKDYFKLMNNSVFGKKDWDFAQTNKHSARKS